MIDYYNRKSLNDEELLKKHTNDSTRNPHRKKPILLRILSTGIGMAIAVIFQGISVRLLVQRARTKKTAYK